jgi:hypothetical protein
MTSQTRKREIRQPSNVSTGLQARSRKQRRELSTRCRSEIDGGFVSSREMSRHTRGAEEETGDDAQKGVEKSTAGS